MYVKKTIVTKEGNYQFQGELSSEEHDLVLEAGLNYLLEQGILPFAVVDEEEHYNYGGTFSGNVS